MTTKDIALSSIDMFVFACIKRCNYLLIVKVHTYT